MGPDSDPVYVAALQGSHEKTDEKKLKVGDVIDSTNTFTAFSLGDAVLLQYSHEEKVPEPEKKSSTVLDGPEAEKPKKSSSSSKSKK